MSCIILISTFIAFLNNVLVSVDIVVLVILQRCEADQAEVWRSYHKYRDRSQQNTHDVCCSNSM